MSFPTAPLGSLCDVLDRLRRPITKSARKAGEYPYYGATGIVDYVDGYLFDEPLVLLGEDGAKWGAGEKSAFAASGRYWVNNHAHIMRPNRAKLLDDWLIYILNWQDLSPFITGLTVPKLNQERMREIPVPLPPLEEQRRIVAVLDEAFAAIATATAHAEKNLENAREILSGQLTGALQNIDQVEVVPINKVAFIQEGPGIRKYEYQDDGFPMINVRCVQDGWIDMSKGRAANIELANGKWQHFQVQEGDILFTTSGTIGRCAIVDQADLPLLMNTSVVRFRSESDDLMQRYLYHFLRSDLFQRPLAALASGTAIANVGPTHIKTLSISLPSLQHQKQIIELLDETISLSAELAETYQSKIDALDDLKQSLLHRAFSGALTEGALELA